MPVQNAFASLAPAGQKVQRMPSVMSRLGQWVPPDHPDAMYDPMQAQPPQPIPVMPPAPAPAPAPMPASGDAGTLGNLYAQMQRGAPPPPPQAGDWRNAIAGGGIGADPNLMPQVGQQRYELGGVAPD